jgi:putative transposase
MPCNIFGRARLCRAAEAVARFESYPRLRRASPYQEDRRVAQLVGEILSSRFHMLERPVRGHPAEGVLIFREQPTIVFATICSHKRRSHLANDSVHNALLESWRAATAWLVGFYLIMRDHLRLFSVPNDEDRTLEGWVSFWKCRIRRQLGTSEAVFQAHSFHHRLRRDQSYSEKWDYVRMNPVRAGLVSDPDQWTYQGVLNELPWWD